MKLVIVALMVLSAFQAMAVDADFSGEVRVRMTTNVADASSDGVVDEVVENLNTEVRNVISGSFRPNESFEANTTLYVSQNHLLSNSVNSTMVAYGDWMVSDEFMVRFGQSTYELGEGLVIGTNDFQELPTIFSGAILTYSSGDLGVDLGLVKGPDMSDASATDAAGVLSMASNPGNLLIASVDLRSLPDMLKDGNVHVVVTDLSSYVDGDEEKGDVYVGANTTLDISEDLDLDVVVSLDSVKFENLKQNFLVKAGLRYNAMNDVKLYVGAYADGETYTPLYNDIHSNAGKADVARLGGGLIYGKVAAYYSVNSKSGVGASGYYFHKGNDSISDGNIEVDLFYKNKFSSSVMGKVVASVLKKDNIYETSAYANLSMKF